MREHMAYGLAASAQNLRSESEARSALRRYRFRRPDGHNHGSENPKVPVVFTPDQFERICAGAKAQDISFGEQVRRLIDKGLAASDLPGNGENP